jgi:hypothetical protein
VTSADLNVCTTVIADTSASWAVLFAVSVALWDIDSRPENEIATVPYTQDNEPRI